VAYADDRVGEETPGDTLGAQAAEDVRTVAKGGAVQIAGQLSQRGLSTLFIAVATRVLSTAGYGIYRQVAQLLAVAGQLGLAGFNYASMRFIARARAQGAPGGVRGAVRVGLSGTAIASTLVVGAVLLFAEPLARAFADEGADLDALSDYFRLGAAYVPLFAFMQVLRYCTQAYKTMVPSVVAGNIVQPAARFVLGIGALAAGMAIAGAVASLALSMAVGAAVAAFYYRRMLDDEERRARPRAQTGPMVRFAIPQAGASMLGIQTLGLGVIVLGLYSRNFEVGVFAIALALQGPGTVFLGGIVNIWAPVVSDLYDQNAIERLGALYQTITRWVVTFSFPVFAALILEPDLFTPILAPPGGADAAAPVVAVLAIGNIFYTGSGPTGYVISMSGRPTVNLINSVVAVALYFALGYAVVPEHGALGMAIVDAAVTALINSVRVLQAWFLVGVHPFGRSFLKPVLATLAGAGVLLAWRVVPGDSIPLEIAGVVLGAIVYLVVLRALGMDPEERHLWTEIRKRMPGRIRYR
jgi:O-antigen/teichoic acid export membrane protein